MPSSVMEPGTFMLSRSLAVMWTSSRRTKSWLGVGMCLLKTSVAMDARAGCATQVLEVLIKGVLIGVLKIRGAYPSWPARTSRSLSARTLSMALSLAALSSLIGIWAAMPPMAWTPRLWHVWMRDLTWAS